MATGQLPFRGDSTATIFGAILNREPVPAARLNPDLPTDLERIINRALEKDRELRYQHASEMRSELMRLKRDSDSGRIPSSGSRASRSSPKSLQLTQSQWLSRRLDLYGSGTLAWPFAWHYWQQSMWRTTFGPTRIGRVVRQKLRKSAIGTNQWTTRGSLPMDTP